jgi:Leucine-rich repeat (LRR) protein
MNKLYKNVLISIFINLDVQSLASCYLTCKKFKNAIESPLIWMNLLKSKYNNKNKYQELFGKDSDKKTYLMCYSIDKLQKWKPNKFKGSIEEIYNLKELYLNGNQINVILPELGKLVNLTDLYLKNNQISIIPSEIKNALNNCNIKI